MNQLVSLWNALTPQRRAIVIAAGAGMFVAILMLTRIAATTDMALLYSGLESDAAGEVIAALDREDIAYEVRGDAIHVDARKRDAARMTLAADGLPSGGRGGYELLDELSGFGTTTQMFDAAYWRAKEGELARTIVADPDISRARVHIANGSDRPFRGRIEATASLHVTTKTGGLGRQGAQALRHLVAAAVPGLRPDGVQIIDTHAGLIAARDDLAGLGAGEDRAQAVAGRVERLLEAHLGAGNAVVEASVETETRRESISERNVDPDSRVPISSDRVEQSSSSSRSRDDGVSVASNLPDGDAADEGEGSQSRSEDSETRERINYEISETRREILNEPGDVRRLTIAALVDGVTEMADDGTETWSPRPDAELASLRSLIAAAVGFDEARGDIITIESLPLAQPQEAGTEAQSAGMLDGLRLDAMSLIQLATLTMLVLVLALFVLRPILAQALAANHEPLPEAAGRAQLADAGAADAPPPDAPDATAGATRNLPALQADHADTPDASDPAARLRQLIDRRQSEAVEILRGWMEDREEQS